MRPRAASRGRLRVEDRRDLDIPPARVTGHGASPALEAADASCLGRHDGSLGVRVALALPEVRPRAAADGVEVANLHHALATLAHEREARIQVEDLDAVGGRGEHAAHERGLLTPLPEGAPQFELRHHLMREDAQGLLLDGGEIARLVVEHANGADGMALGGLQERPGVELQMGLAGDQRIAREARVAGGVRDEEELLFQDRAGAERAVERRLAHAEADFRLEELAALADQVHDRDGRAADRRSECGDLVEPRFTRRVEDLVAVKGRQAGVLGVEASDSHGRLYWFNHERGRCRSACPNSLSTCVAVGSVRSGMGRFSEGCGGASATGGVE